MRIILIVLTLVHGLIHLLGFAKSIKPESISQLTQNISKQAGLVWLIAASLFVLTAVAILLNKDFWWMIAVPGVIISQIMIIASWQDAKFGTIANIIILIAAITGCASWSFQGSFRSDVKEALSLSRQSKPEILTEKDLQHLPAIVQKYLRYAGVVNKEKLRSVKIEFEGEMRSKKMDWFTFTSEQYNTFDPLTRLFFMQGKMMGTTVPGYHAFKNGTATMLVKLLALIPVADNKGELMDKGETVTVFNDMCLMAPASLIDERITWGNSDSTFADAVFTNNDITISAKLLFNEQGQLVNFISDDRYDLSGDTPMNYRFSTPVRDYRNYNGINVMSYGEAFWHYPDDEFVYGKFRLKNIEYNCKIVE